MKYQGITLIELLVVIAILLILSLGGVISWHAYASSLRLTLSARKIVSDLRQAQSQSVAEQISYLIRFDINDDTYKYIRLIPDPDNPEGTIEEEIRQESLYSKIQITEIIGLDNNEEKEVGFNAGGAPSDIGTIELRNEKEKIKIIEIKPSGYIKSY